MSITATMIASHPTHRGRIVVPYWFASSVLMATRGIGVEIRRPGAGL